METSSRRYYDILLFTTWYAASNEPCDWDTGISFDVEISTYCEFYEWDSTDLTCTEGVDCSKSPSTFLSFDISTGYTDTPSVKIYKAPYNYSFRLMHTIRCRYSTGDTWLETARFILEL